MSWKGRPLRSPLVAHFCPHAGRAACSTTRVGCFDARRRAGRHLARGVSGAVSGEVPEAAGFVFAAQFTGDSCAAIFEQAFQNFLDQELGDRLACAVGPRFRQRGMRISVVKLAAAPGS